MKITKLFRVIMTALIIASFCSAPLYAATNIGTSISTDDDLTVDGDVQFTTGAGAGLVLTSDALGNATWQAVPAPAETDPIYGAAPAAGITAPDIVNWDTAFGWGNHAVSGYLLLETDPQIGANTLSYVPRWNGSALVTGTIYDDGAAIAIGHAAPSVELDVNGDLRIRNLMNCDTIDTDANGNFSCGTDNSGSADFSDGGEAGGANRTLGNTDTFNLGFLTDNQTRLSIESDGDIKYNAPATAGFTFDGTTTRTGTAPLIFVDGVIDTTVAGDDLSIIDVDVTRDAGDTGSLYGVDVELTYNNLGAGEDLYGGVFNVNLNNALADGTIIGVLGSSIATTSATGASIGAANFSVNSGSGFSVGTYSIGRDATSASAYTAGGIFASAQDINSSVMSAGVAVMGASTGGASGIPTDFGLAVTDYQGDPTFGDEGFVVGVGVHPTTLTTGILIQPPAGSTYTTGIDID
ncbi:hypothetical protein KKF04_05595, partial [Patescibacteria group bacterium]|nr:hypothetical protein [Patescibacteria group bacterium]